MADVLTQDQIREECQLGDDARAWSGRTRALGLVMLAVGVGLGYTAEDHFHKFLCSYLTSYMFLLSLCLGGLFFTMVHHLVGAKWFVAVRRVAEVLAGGFPLMAVLFLPILVPMLMGNHHLYHWTDPERVASDHILHGKAAYLNVPFFTIRAVIFFAVWIGLARFFLGKSAAQDENGDPQLTVRMRRLAAPGIILFALTTTFAAFDWLMSLEPHWFSTIFGVYYFAGTMISFFAMMSLTFMLLQEKGRLKTVVTQAHYHDLGKYLFAFTFFWGYVAFSQYMLIWYADLPEETYWFDLRQSGNWVMLSKFLVLFHFIVPFGGLLSRHVKRNKSSLAFFCILMLLMHWVDMYWLVMPSMRTETLGFSFVDVACLLGLGGLFVGGFLSRLRGQLLAPVRDPYFEDSLHFRQSF
ncbi:MAG: quinol:cytochrome C oxidoreductase [Planctomycetota bacterium JB042]